MTSRYLPPLFSAAVLGSCVMPDTPLWNERETLSGARMPGEMVYKVLVSGNVESVLCNPVSGTRKGFAMMRHRAGLLSENLVDLELIPEIKTGSGDIEGAMSALGLPEPQMGTVEYLIGGKPFFDEVEKDINAAEKSVDTRVFIFDNDDVAQRYADLLRGKSKTVRCRVMMDRLGSISSWWTAPASKMPDGYSPMASVPHYLKQGESKVQVRMTRNPYLVADHGKLITIDDRIAYLGGMNIGREYRYEWHDMMVRVTGPVVSDLQWEFDRTWSLQGALGDWQRPFKRKRKIVQPEAEGAIPMRILRTGVGKIEVEKAMLAAVRVSKERVYVQNSYFTSQKLVDEMVAAAKRGVDVRLVLPSDNDSALLDQANMAVAKALLSAGAKLYRYPKFSHVKAVVCDDWSCVGSANLDGLSMRINDELNIAYTDEKKTEELVKKLFRKDFAASTPLKVGEKRKGALKQIILQQL